MTSTPAHEPVTPDECGESIRLYGACEHGPAYTVTTRLITDEVRETLQQTCTALLLTAAYALTHQMHETKDEARADLLREQRGDIEQEIIDRLGAQYRAGYEQALTDIRSLGGEQA